MNRNTDTTIRFTGEFDDGNDAPASYWLNNWKNCDDAIAAIMSVLRTGQRASFETPYGLMIVSVAS